MSYETKMIIFHVILVKMSSGSRCSRALLKNIAIKSAHSGVREVPARIELS